MQTNMLHILLGWGELRRNALPYSGALSISIANEIAEDDRSWRRMAMVWVAMVVFSLLDSVSAYSVWLLFEGEKFQFWTWFSAFSLYRRHRSLCILLHSIHHPLSTIHYPFSIVAFSMFLLMPILLLLLLSFRSNDHILFRKCKSNVSAQHKHKHKHNQIQIRRIITVIISFRLLRCCRWPATIFTKRRTKRIDGHLEKWHKRKRKTTPNGRIRYGIKQRMIYLNAWVRHFGHIFQIVLHIHIGTCTVYTLNMYLTNCSVQMRLQEKMQKRAELIR